MRRFAVSSETGTLNSWYSAQSYSCSTSCPVCSRSNTWRGVAFLGLGLAKKILLANPCGMVADLAFDAGSLGMVDAWYGVVAYAFQIYYDFSG